MALPSNVTLTTHAVIDKAQPNWTVESVDAPGQVWGKDVKADSRPSGDRGVWNSRRADRSFAGGERQDHRDQERLVPANGRATVEFPSLEVPYEFSRCEVKIDSDDAFPDDDLRRFAVERSDPQQGVVDSRL